MFRSVAIAVVLSLTSAGAQAGDFTGLGDLPGGVFRSNAQAISADGTTVVGFGAGAAGMVEAFRWTASEGMVSLTPNSYGIAFGISADGSTIVGHRNVSGTGPSTPFRWTTEYGMGDLNGVSQGDAYNASADGGVVVGSDGFGNGYRWTSSGGAVGLGGVPPGYSDSHPYGISADGSVISGVLSSDTYASNPQAFRWTSEGGVVGLGSLTSAHSYSHAYAVSADGTAVVGWSANAVDQPEAFRWTTEEGMVGLGILSGYNYSLAQAASADASVIVGFSANGPDNNGEAFIWTEATGMESLFDVLVANGTTGLTGWTLNQALGVSADGRSIAGWGTNPLGQEEAFIAHISPVPIPAAFWLFGGALGLLGVVRRRVI